LQSANGLQTFMGVSHWKCAAVPVYSRRMWVSWQQVCYYLYKAGRCHHVSSPRRTCPIYRKHRH